MTFFDLTGYGYATNIVGATLNGHVGIQSSTTQFYLTSGVTGVSNGILLNIQYALTGNSGSYIRPTGTLTGFRFFAGMTDGATTQSTTLSPIPTQALLGLQAVRSTGVSGRNDETYYFISKTNGASAQTYLVNTQCPIVPGEPLKFSLYANEDFRNGIFWSIKRIRQDILYSGYFSGEMRQLPLVSSSSQILLKPSLCLSTMSGFNVGLRINGIYCQSL